jgi:hypothetical protein
MSHELNLPLRRSSSSSAPTPPPQPHERIESTGTGTGGSSFIAVVMLLPLLTNDQQTDGPRGGSGDALDELAVVYELKLFKSILLFGFLFVSL